MDVRMDASLGPAEFGGLFPDRNPCAAGYSHLHRNVMASTALDRMHMDFDD